MSEVITKQMVTIGRCKVCGGPIEVAQWVADRLKMPVDTCSRKCSNVLIGVEDQDDLETEA